MNRRHSMNAKGILEAYAALAPWLKGDTVDRVIFGDPDKEIRKLLVTWQVSSAAVEYAAANGYGAIMTHEPTFWFHRDEWDNVSALPEGSHKKAAALRKASLLEGYGITVLRNHDAWDAMPEFGIPWAWARHLGLSGPTDTRNLAMLHRYDIEPAALSELAARIGERTASFADAPPTFFGRADSIVRALGIGTGCITTLEDFLDMGCDAVVACDDGSCYWHDTAWALESGIGVIRVSHFASEEAGMKSLSEHAAKLLTGCEVGYLPYDGRAFGAGRAQRL